MEAAGRPLPSLRRPREAVPSADLPSLLSAARRTRAARLLLAVASLALLAGIVLLASQLNPGRTALLPAGRSSVVVLDLSRSIDENSLARIGGVLRTVIRADAPIGLVVFSDVAYELLPPRTPARDLRPMLRYFTRSNGAFPANPWSSQFRGGTRISQGLEFARTMLQNAHVRHGSILLVSDLGAASGDQAALTRDLISFRGGSIPLKIVPLNPLFEDKAYFERLLGKDPFVASPNSVLGNNSPTSGFESVSTTPVALLVAGGALLLLLALNELWCGRLELPRRSAS
jgi:hypothetical protein